MIDLPESLIILINKLSHICDLLGSRFFIIAKMSGSLISRDEINFSVFRQNGGKEGCTDRQKNIQENGFFREV